MGRSRRKSNKLNHVGIQKLKQRLEEAWPYVSLKIAGFIKDPEALGLSNDLKFKDQFVSAVAEVRNEDVNVRVYRKPDAKDTHAYDVDEIRRANRPIITQPAKSEILNHWLEGSIQDDLMRRNNLTVEVVRDGPCGLKPNVVPDGTVKALINFEDALALDESTPGEQTWFCRTCRKRYTMRYKPTMDAIALTHVFRQHHLSRSPECRGEVEVLIRSAISLIEADELLAYEPA
jgi:hypothetical protein